MFLRRTLCLALVLSAACDDDVAEPAPSPATPDAAVVDAYVAPSIDAALPQLVERDASAIEDARVELEDASPDAGTTPEDAAVDAGPLDCSSLGLTYDNYGAEFLYLWCLSCHNRTPPILTTPEQVRLWGPALRAVTVDSRRMPPGGNANYLRDQQREQFGRWLDCDAP